MRRLLRRTAAALALAALVGSTAPSAQTPQKPAPVSLTGRWAMALDIREMGVANVALVLAQDGEKITGTYTGRYGEFPLAGTLKAKAIEFTVTLDTEGGRSTMYFSGEIAEDGRTMKGGATIEGLGDASWSAKKHPDKLPTRN